MSLDLYFECPCCERELFEVNVTHNLGTMADAAGLYDAMWRPDEHDYKTARSMIGVLTSGLEALEATPDAYRLLNPENGWGSYEGFLKAVRNTLAAAIKYPDALVRASR